MDYGEFASEGAAASASLTSAQKAAAILVAMGKPAAGRLLKFFKHDELKALIEAARMLRTIPQHELERIIAEFEDEFAEGAGLMDSADTMDTLLSETFSPEEMNAVLGNGLADAPAALPPVWPQIERLEPQKLADFLAHEHPQTSALILTSIASPAAAKVLVILPKPVRGEVIKRMLSIGTVKPEAMEMLEQRLRTGLLDERSGKSSAAGQIRIASVLNELDKDAIEELLEDMAAAGTADLEAIRSKLFSFEDIVYLSQKSRLALFDGMDSELVTLALRNANRDLSEAILSSMGARARRMIEAELAADSGDIAITEITRARREIASAAIRLASQGRIELPAAQDAA